MRLVIHSDAEAIGCLIRGGVSVMPTDTLYCLVACAKHPEAVKRVYRLKQWQGTPGPVLAANLQQLIELGADPQHLAQAAERYWSEGMLATCVEMPLGRELAYLHQDTGRQALRVVTERRLRGILLETGPLLISSASRADQEPAINLEQAFAYFRDEVDTYVDGGNLASRRASRIVRMKYDGEEEIRSG